MSRRLELADQIATLKEEIKRLDGSEYDFAPGSVSDLEYLIRLSKKDIDKLKERLLEANELQARRGAELSDVLARLADKNRALAVLTKELEDD